MRTGIELKCYAEYAAAQTLFSSDTVALNCNGREELARNMCSLYSKFLDEDEYPRRFIDEGVNVISDKTICYK